MQNRIQTALISVHDKAGLTDFAAALVSHGVRIISTGGTARLLRESSVEVQDVSELTRFPEMLGGRVKTLHPHIHGALLADRRNPEHLKTLKDLEIEPIDLVVVNLYPFEKVAAEPEADSEALVENIDIGGVTLMRAAAKNFRDVAVVVSPQQYAGVLRELKENGARLSLATRLHLAKHAFEVVAQYDAAILEELGNWVWEEGKDVISRHPELFPSYRFVGLRKMHELRYGENPHQQAAVYRHIGTVPPGLATAELLQGKELSYNNLLDLDAAWRLSTEFEEPAAVIVKHNNPCGVATAEDVTAAYQRALACDPVSAFGSVLAFNREINRSLAEEITQNFVEAIVAPGYFHEARDIFSKKKNLRLVERPLMEGGGSGNVSSGGSFTSELELRQIDGGFLAQTRDWKLLDETTMKVVSQRSPTEEEWRALRFAWRVVKHVKSNAIVFVRGGQTVGVGAGQMSRVDSVKIAVMKVQQPLAGSVVGSDAFFPFRDGVDEIAKAGATAVIQPGGSVRDMEVIEAANEHNLAMVFTGIRHFRH